MIIIQPQNHQSAEGLAAFDYTHVLGRNKDVFDKMGDFQTWFVSHFSHGLRLTKHFSHGLRLTKHSSVMVRVSRNILSSHSKIVHCHSKIVHQNVWNCRRV